MITVLLVEDDVAQQRLLMRLLARHFEVTALDQFGAMSVDWGRFDVALVDVMMPIHDGPSLVRDAAARCASMPYVILYSALPSELMQREAAALNGVIACYYLTKSGTASTLIETIHELCAS